MQLNNTEVIKFLERVYPKGPWALTAICPSKKKIETKTLDRRLTE